MKSLVVSLPRVRLLLARRLVVEKHAGRSCTLHKLEDIRTRLGNGCPTCLQDARELLTELNDYQKQLNEWKREAMEIFSEGVGM